MHNITIIFRLLGYVTSMYEHEQFISRFYLGHCRESQMSKILVGTSLRCEKNLPHLLIQIRLNNLSANNGWNQSPRRHMFRWTFICHILKTGPD